MKTIKKKYTKQELDTMYHVCNVVVYELNDFQPPPKHTVFAHKLKLLYDTALKLRDFVEQDVVYQKT